MKQRNPKSINLQFNNCRNVEISKLYQNTLKPSKDQINELVESALNDMLTIVFDITNTQRNRDAVEIAGDLLDGKIIKSTVWVTLPDSQILEKAYAIKHLARYIQDLKGTKAYFRGAPVELNRFINTLTQIKVCSHGHFQSKDRKACWRNLTDEGWGCKFINSVKRQLGKITSFNTSTYWYNFGYFCQGGEWRIDKDLIREVIFKEVNTVGLNVCPHFCTKTVLNNIASLPDSIEVDNIHFKNYYRKDFLGSSLLVIPENIRHIPQVSEEEKREQEKAAKIKELEYLIGMNKISGKELLDAKEQLLVLKGVLAGYAKSFMMNLYPDKGYRYSDN
jgi:hypothetical protein